MKDACWCWQFIGYILHSKFCYIVYFIMWVDVKGLILKVPYHVNRLLWGISSRYEHIQVMLCDTAFSFCNPSDWATSPAIWSVQYHGLPPEKGPRRYFSGQRSATKGPVSLTDIEMPLRNSRCPVVLLLTCLLPWMRSICFHESRKSE